jgi:hypothetical protein
MHSIAHRGCHDTAPKPWKHVPKMTGDYDLDATILHRKNPDMARRLAQHLRTPVGPSYGIRTQSTAYNGNHGDD